MSCRPQGAIVLGEARFISFWISEDCVFELGKVKPCTSRRLREMRISIPAGNAAIPKERGDLSTELEPSPPLVGGDPKATRDDARAAAPWRWPMSSGPVRSDREPAV